MPGVSLAEFNQRPATHVVSLGAYCATAYNLRRYYEQAGERLPAHNFDWWISPLSGLIQFFEEPDLEGLYDIEALECVVAEDGFPVVRHKRLGIEFVHEFQRRTLTPALVDAPGFLADLAKAKERTLALGTRLLGLNREGNHVAFFRTAHPSDFGDAGGQLARLVAVLDTVYDKATYTVVVTHGQQDAWPMARGGAFVPFASTGKGDWRGHEPDWNVFLAGTGIMPIATVEG